MKLNVSNPAHNGLHESLGITDERAEYLQGNIVTVYNSYPADAMIKTAELIQRIAEPCNTTEEVVFCTLLLSQILYQGGGGYRQHPARSPLPPISHN